MKTQIIVYFSVLLLMFGCSSLKKVMVTEGENLQEVAIHNAILDFSKSCKLYERDSVFSIDFSDSVYNEAFLVQVDEKTGKWERGSLYDGIVSVEINAFPAYQYYYSEETKSNLPSRYIIKDGKLFYWWDNNYPVTEEIITVLWKYNLLQTDLIIPDFSTNDNQKGVDYYFCKNDLSKYKKVINNIGLGYYKPPKLKCKCN